MGTSSGRVDAVLGIDIGSTNVKVVALDAAGHVVARVHRATPRPADEPSIDAARLFDTIEEMALAACGDRYAVTAASAAGVGEDGVLVDAGLAPLTRALPWFDPRRTELFDALKPSLGPADGIGTATDAARTLVGWAWARARPGAEPAASWIALTDYVASRWSGTAFLSDTLAARTGAWRPLARTWIDARVEATLGSAQLLPAVLRTGAAAGELRSPRLAEAGVLAPGALVVAGGHDHPVGGWGVDRLHPGAVLDSMGTAEVVVAQTRVPPDLSPGAFDVSPGIHNASGATVLRVVELARNMQWASRDPDVAHALNQLISGSAAPDDGLYSHAFRPGAAGGHAPSYAPQAPAKPLSRASAVLGALAALGDQAITSIQTLTEADTPVYTAGGWARSRGWLDIKRAVTGKDARGIAEPEVTAVGAALLAAHALGWSPSVTTALNCHPETSGSTAH
ncbi:FGGY family carbohydrate kinase [Streptomyces sp. NPDC091215]|uniref:FGGY-family carbohydrate kinase n=1 Tax=Streptomyces sp. NPDC091215 TaxID=3155192 RepID=UPI00343EE4AA